MTKLLLAALSLALCASCSYAPPSTTPEPGSGVGGTGNMAFNHEPLGANKHMVTVTAAPGVMETEGSIAQRIYVSANRFAAQTCPRGYDFDRDPTGDQGTAGGFMKRSKSYVFTCKP